MVSGFGNHSTSRFFFLIPSCNSLKGASYQRAAFSSAAAASSYSRARRKRVGGAGTAGGSVLGALPVPGASWRPAQPTRAAPVTVCRRVTLSQPLHCFLQHTVACPAPAAGSSHPHSSASRAAAAGETSAPTSSARSSARSEVPVVSAEGEGHVLIPRSPSELCPRSKAATAHQLGAIVGLWIHVG